MKFFPVILDLECKNVLVVGGGPVAFQKIQDVLRAGAQVTVVTKSSIPEVKKLAKQKKVKYIERPFRDPDIMNQDLVFCATNDEKLNRHLSSLCRAAHVWANVVDKPSECDFIMPALFRRGEILVAISTGGASPAVAKFIRKRLEKNIGPEVDGLVGILKSVRGKLVSLELDKRRRILKNIITEKNLSLIRAGKKALVLEKLDELIKRR